MAAAPVLRPWRGLALGLAPVGLAAAPGLAAAINATPALDWALRWAGVGDLPGLA